MKLSLTIIESDGGSLVLMLVVLFICTSIIAIFLLLSSLFRRNCCFFLNCTQRISIVMESCGCSAFQLLQAVCANHDLMHRVCILGLISLGCVVRACFCAHRGFL